MEWRKQNKYHSEILTILGRSAAETVSYVPQHLTTNYQPTLKKNSIRVKISFIPYQKPEITQVPLCRMSCMDWGSLASCSCRISDTSLYCNTNTHYTARNCTKCSLTSGRVHTTATIYIIFTFPNEKGVVLWNPNPVGSQQTCPLFLPSVGVISHSVKLPSRNNKFSSNLSLQHPLEQFNHPEDACSKFPITSVHLTTYSRRQKEDHHPFYISASRLHICV